MVNGKRRVVVTGLGAIAPNGIGVPTIWKNLKEGVSGIAPIQSFDTSNHSVKIAAEVRDFDPAAFIDPRDCRRFDRVCQFALVAVDEALREAGLGVGFEGVVEPTRAGVIFGSGIGGILTLETQHDVLRDKGPRRVSPLMIPMLIGNIIPGNIAIRHGFKGLNFGLVSACATATHCIGEAFLAIAGGRIDVAVSGGSEGAITPLTVAGFANMKALSTRNELGARASAPFDLNRDGFVIGEGAACIVLEEYEHARARGARMYGEVVGYGATCDAHHITAPADGGEGIVRAMRLALGEAGLTPEDVSYVNAHGTSTPHNDRHETLALKTVFGDVAHRVPVSSTKSMIGHLLGGAGAIEAVATCKSMEDGVVHPTVNLETPDPDCDLDYVPEGARQVDVRIAISNSMGFGGQNASLVFRKMDD